MGSKFYLQAWVVETAIQDCGRVMCVVQQTDKYDEIRRMHAFKFD